MSIQSTNTLSPSANKLGLRPASDCTHCDSCAHKCPQHLPIPDWIAKVSEAFDK